MIKSASILNASKYLLTRILHSKNKTMRRFCVVFFIALFLTAAGVYAQAPTVNYNGPQAYTKGVTITPLVPTSTGVATPGYSGSPLVTGSGFSRPSGVAIDGFGNIYVADAGNNAVKKIPVGGGTPVSLGSGFNNPLGLAFRAGKLYIADAGNNAVKTMPIAGGTPTIVATGFNSPAGLWVDGAGNIFVADAGNNAIKEIPVAGGSVVTLGSGFSNPGAVAVDAYGNIYAADTGNNAVKMIPVGGGSIVTMGSGFSGPSGISVDASGNVYVADTGHKLVKKIPVGSNTPVAVGLGFSSAFSPYGIIVDNTGNVYAVDHAGNVVDEILPTGGYYIHPALPRGLSMSNSSGTISGTPNAASTTTNYSIVAYNSSGNTTASLSISVGIPNQKPVIAYSSPLSFITGSPISSVAPVNSGGVVPAPTIELYETKPFNAYGLTVDGKGNLFIADRYSNNIEEIPAGTDMLKTVATGFNKPSGVAVDAAGNIYVADFGSNAVKEILASSNTVITLATGFTRPLGVAVDVSGNVYVTDSGNNVIKKIPAGGGTPVVFATGFSLPIGLAIDAAGNLYVADSGNNAIKKIPAGGGTAIILAPGTLHPNSVSVDGFGNVYFTDPYNSTCISKIMAGTRHVFELGFGFLGGPAAVASDAIGNMYLSEDVSPAASRIAKMNLGGYYVYPALPYGLTLNPNTGMIAGAPQFGTVPTNYTVTAFNASGSGDSNPFSITISGQSQKPIINYNGPQVFATGATITPLSPVNTGGAIEGAPSIVLNSTSNLLIGVAVDHSGTVYVADNGNSQVKKMPPNPANPLFSGTPVIIGSGFLNPTGVAVDAAGNVYVADYGHNAIKEIPAGGGAVITLGTGFQHPYGIALDSGGNIYFTDSGNNEVKKIPAGGGAAVILASGFSDPTGIAVDGAGNVYITDAENKAVKEIKVGGSVVVILNTGLNWPNGIAVTSSGDIFCSDMSGYSIFLIPHGSNTAIPALSFTGYGLALDTQGNLYATHATSVDKASISGYFIDKPLPAGLWFDTNIGTIGGTPASSSPATVYTITGYNIAGSSSTTLNIAVNAPANVRLSALSLSVGTLTPAFTGNTGNYTASVGNGVTAITLTPTEADPTSTIKVNGAPVTSGAASAAIPLIIGPNVITVMVVAQNGLNSNTYTLTVTRAASSNAKLLSLTTDQGILTPAFNSTITSYSQTIPTTVAFINITPTTVEPNATIIINGVGVKSGTAWASMSLNYGANTINIVVTAPDGVTKITYTINVIRTASTDASLAALTVNYGKLSPAFAPGTTNYTDTVLNTAMVMTVIATTNASTSILTINGRQTISGTNGGGIALANGSNTITVVVTAQDRVTAITYTIVVYRIPVNPVQLTNLTVNQGKFLPSFTPAESNYSVFVLNNVSSILITATTSGPNYTTTTTSNTVTSDSPSTNIPLIVGANSITVETKLNGKSVCVYLITVTRAPGELSTDSKLSGLVSSAGNMTYKPIQALYNLFFGYATASITLTPTADDANATIKVNGVTVASGTSSAEIPVIVGPDTVNVVVTAIDYR